MTFGMAGNWIEPGIPVGTRVSVAALVAVDMGVSVVAGEVAVAVCGSGVFVGGSRVSVGWGVGVGGTCVAVGTGVGVALGGASRVRRAITVAAAWVEIVLTSGWALQPADNIARIKIDPEIALKRIIFLINNLQRA